MVVGCACVWCVLVRVCACVCAWVDGWLGGWVAGWVGVGVGVYEQDVKPQLHLTNEDLANIAGDGARYLLSPPTILFVSLSPWQIEIE